MEFAILLDESASNTIFFPKPSVINFAHAYAINFTYVPVSSLLFSYMHTAVSTKVTPQKCKTVRDNVDWHYG